MKYKIVSKDKKSFIIIPELKKLGLKHCFTTIDMDMGRKTNKSIENYKDDINTIYKLLNIKPRQLYSGKQTHSKNIKVIAGENEGKEDIVGRHIPDTDGLITNKKNIGLMTRYADCTPIILFDPKKQVHSNIHSGWKGTLQKIGPHGVKLMEEKYGSKAEDIIAILGPSIGREDFEVEIDVMEMFQSTFDFHDEIISRKNEVKYLIDLGKINIELLIKAGIKKENINIIDLSTYSTPFLHSFRRDGKSFGLMGAITCIL